jgi:ankyrin repeat protein
MLAAQAGKREFAKLLLEAGANISAQDYAGLTAEAIARLKQFNDVAELLTVKQSFSIGIE